MLTVCYLLLAVCYQCVNCLVSVVSCLLPVCFQFVSCFLCFLAVCYLHASCLLNVVSYLLSVCYPFVSCFLSVCYLKRPCVYHGNKRQDQHNPSTTDSQLCSDDLYARLLKALILSCQRRLRFLNVWNRQWLASCLPHRRILAIAVPSCQRCER